MKLSISLRNRTFRSARIDPSSLPKHRRTNFIIFPCREKSNIEKHISDNYPYINSRLTSQNPYVINISIKIYSHFDRKSPKNNYCIPHSYPLKGAVMYISFIDNGKPDYNPSTGPQVGARPHWANRGIYVYT